MLDPNSTPDFAAARGQTVSMHIDTYMASGIDSVASSAPAAYAGTQPQLGLAPYSAQQITVFTLPTASDNTLLTPTSPSGSPSSQHQPSYQHHHRRGYGHSYHCQPSLCSTAVRSVKPLTPPATSSSMQYQYSTGVESHAAGEPASAPGYDLSSYSYNPSPREDGAVHSNSSNSSSSNSNNGNGSNTFHGSSTGHASTGMDPYYSSYVSGPPTDSNGASPPPIGSYSFASVANNDAYMSHHQQRLPRPSSSYPPPYSSAQYASVSATAAPHHPSMAQDLAPLDAASSRPRLSRTSVSEYHMVPAMQAPSMAAQVGLPFFANRNDSAMDARRSLGSMPAVEAASDQQRTPRSQGAMSGDVNTIFRDSGNPNHSPNGAPEGAAGTTASPHDAPMTVAATLPDDLTRFCVSTTGHVVLNEKAATDERRLFDIHQAQQAVRGKGMWENIVAEFVKDYPEPTTTARLQMKFTRAVRKYSKWPKQDFELLMKIYDEDVRHRYTRIAAIFKERGGCKTWEWKAPEIEHLLVRLGLEEASQDEATKLRRRRRSAARRLEKSVGAHAPAHNQDAVAMAWNGNTNSGYAALGMASQQQFPLPPPHAHQQFSQTGTAGYEFAPVVALPNYNASHEEAIADDVSVKYPDMVVDMASNGSPSADTPGSSQSMANSNSNGSNDHTMPNGTVGSGSMASQSLPSLGGQYAGRSMRSPYDQSHCKPDPYK